MRFGAIHQDAPAAIRRLNLGPARDGANVDWFADVPADGDDLDNDDLGCCVPAADFRVIELLGGAINRDLVIARYEAVGGYRPVDASSDAGTNTAVDMFNWMSSPIIDADGRPWSIEWLSVGRADLIAALAVAPVLLTLGLPGVIATRPELWGGKPGATWRQDKQHRLVLGNWTPRGPVVRTWGRDYLIAPALFDLMFIAADVAIPDFVPDLRLAGAAFDRNMTEGKAA